MADSPHRYRPLVRGPVVNTDYCDRQGCDVTRERLAPAATGTLDRRPYWCDAPPRESPVGYLAEPPCRMVGALMRHRWLRDELSGVVRDAFLAARLDMDITVEGEPAGHGYHARAA